MRGRLDAVFATPKDVLQHVLVLLGYLLFGLFVCAVP